MTAEVDGSTARQAIMREAAELFAELGYAKASLRTIAGRAGVDPALVRHYFGSKEGLFVEVVSRTIRPAQVLGEAFASEDPDAAKWLVRHALADWEDPVQRRRIAGVLRSALDLPTAADRLRHSLVPDGVAQRESDDVRMALIGSLFVGIMLSRHMNLLPLPGLAEAGTDVLVRRLAPVVDFYLHGDVDTSAG